jgi:hypothetical protein
MEDLSLHILDIAENSTKAGANLVRIYIKEDTNKDLLQIIIRDNGRGMDPEMVKRATDPFTTTRTTRRVGLGLSMLEHAAQEAGGDLTVKSGEGIGTEIRATFQTSHIDRKPFGDMGSSMISLIVGNPDVDFIYESDFDGEKSSVDTRAIKAELDGTTSISDPAVLKLLRGVFEESLGNQT